MLAPFAVPNVHHDSHDSDDADDIWTLATREAEMVIGITAAAIRDLWAIHHPPVDGDEAALVEYALYGPDCTAREVARETLTRAYIGGPVKRIVAMHAQRQDAEDVRQAAIEGLWRGLNDFDPTRHRRPVATIERAVLASLTAIHAARFGMTVPAADRLKFAKANDAHPEDVEVAAADAARFGLTPAEFWRIYRVKFIEDITPATPEVFAGISGRETPMSSLWDAPVPNDEHDPMVSALLDALDPREREVVARSFGFDGFSAHTEAEIGRAMGLTIQVEKSAGTGAREKCRRVRQIQAAALDKLRVLMGAEEASAA